MSNIIDTLADDEKAARMIYKGLHPRLSAAQDREYGELLRYWQANPEWRRRVERMAACMDLKVLAVNSLKVLLRPTTTDSLFAQRMEDIRGSSNDLDRGLLAMAMVGVAASFFRTGNSLDDGAEETVRPLTITSIEQAMSGLAEKLQAEADKEDDSTRRRDKLLLEGFRLWSERPACTDETVRSSTKTREGIIQLIVNRLVENDMLRPIAQDGTAWYATERFRQQMRDVAYDPLYARYVGPIAAQAA